MLITFIGKLVRQEITGNVGPPKIIFKARWDRHCTKPRGLYLVRIYRTCRCGHVDYYHETSAIRVVPNTMRLQKVTFAARWVRHCTKPEENTGYVIIVTVEIGARRPDNGRRSYTPDFVLIRGGKRKTFGPGTDRSWQLPGDTECGNNL